MKKNYKWIKIVAPVLTLLTAGGISAGYFASNAGKNTIYSQSLMASLNSESLNNENVSNYLTSNKENKTNLLIINKPNFDKLNNLTINDLKETEITKNLIIDFEENKLNNYVIYKKVITAPSKDFVNKIVANRKAIDLGVIFDFNIDVYNPITNKFVKKDFSNQVSAFDFEEMIYNNSKNRQIKAFKLPLKKLAENLEGDLSGYFYVDIDNKNNFEWTFEIKTEKILHHKINEDSPIQNIKFNSIDAKLFVLHQGIDSSGDVERFFWPKPNGPKVPVKLQRILPKNSVVSLNDKEYVLTNNLIDNKPVVINYTNEETASKNDTFKDHSLFKIVLKRKQWESALYEQPYLEKEKVTHPGIKIGFDFLLDIFDNDTEQIQNYNSSLYGFISANNLRLSSKFEQEILNYNTADQRVKNSGFIKIKMVSNLRLNSDLEINFTSSVNDFVIKESVDIDQSKLFDKQKLSFFYNNVNIKSYYDTITPEVNADEIKPNTNFIFNQDPYKYKAELLNMNILADYQNKSKGTYDDSRSVRENWYSIRYSGFYYNYNPAVSSEGVIDVSEYVENNSTYAQKSFLTFEFDGMPSASNLLAIDSSAKNSTTQRIEYANNLHDSIKNKANKKDIKYPYDPKTINHNLKPSELKDAAQNGNIFQVPINNLNTSNLTYLWKEMFLINSTQLSKMPEVIQTARDARTQNKPTYKNSLLTAKFEISLRRSDDYKKVFYKLQTTGSSYFWDWGKDNGPQQGNVGFYLKNLKLDIRT